jgi:hypothetical protein
MDLSTKNWLVGGLNPPQKIGHLGSSSQIRLSIFPILKNMSFLLYPPTCRDRNVIMLRWKSQSPSSTPPSADEALTSSQAPQRRRHTCETARHGEIHKEMGCWSHGEIHKNGEQSFFSNVGKPSPNGEQSWPTNGVLKSTAVWHSGIPSPSHGALRLQSHILRSRKKQLDKVWNVMMLDVLQMPAKSYLVSRGGRQKTLPRQIKLFQHACPLG